MVPKTFEGVTIKGAIGPIDYNVGYLTAIKLRQENKFQKTWPRPQAWEATKTAG